MLPLIDGKQIIPVRLIPLIANAWLGQVTLAGILANMVQVSGWPYPSDHQTIEVSVYDEETGSSELKTITRGALIGRKKRVNGVHAFHLNDDGIPVKMRSSEWEAIYRDVSVLEPVLRKTEETNGVPDSMEAAWRLKATTVLPPGVFLYRDDFELLFQRHIGSFTSITDHDPPDFRMINYSAYIRPEYKILVWEGFGHLRQACEPLQTGLVKRHVFTEEQRSQADRKGCLQYAVEAYLDKNVDGLWEGFKSFLQGKLKLPKEEIFCRKQSYNFYFEKVTNTTLFLKHPKQGAKEGEQGWNQYSADHVSGVIRKEQRKRKKQIK